MLGKTKKTTCELFNFENFETAEMCHYPDLGSDSDWSNREGNLLQPILSPTRSVMRMGLLQSFLKRYFAGKPMVASIGNS